MGRWDPRRASGAQDRPVAWRFRLGVFLLAPCAWLVQLVARSHADTVERVYSRGAYPVVRELVGTLTGWFGWSLAEVLVILLVLLLLLRCTRALRGMLRGLRSVRNVLAHCVSAVLLAAGVLYGWGIFGWGLNYHRQPLAASAGLDTSPATVRELRGLVEALAAEAATLRGLVHEDAAGVMGMADSKRQAVGRASRACDPSAPRHEFLQDASCTPAKPVLVPLLPWLHVGGIFSMYTSEANVNVYQPPAGMLASACHELAHQLGWAREEEASFVGYALCRQHADVDYRYATTQSALSYALGALYRIDRGAAEERVAGMHPGLLRDWEAERLFWARYETPLAEAGERINDAYLRSQGQEAGAESYGLVVDLLVADRRRKAGRIGG